VAASRRRVGTALLVGALALPLSLCVGPAQAEPVGTSFPSDFPRIVDHSLGVPVIGFGAKGHVERTPVIFLHGNNETPYPTDCNSALGKIHEFAQYFHDRGYALSELWGLGYQGDQCDLMTRPSNRASVAHSTLANVPDVRTFVRAVVGYTGARRVDIVGHSLGATLAREWMRQDGAYGVVRKLVSVDGPNHGIINCSPSPQNYYVSVGFNPDSPVCLEYGSDHTPLLKRLNSGDETPGPTRYLTIRNRDTSFVYFNEQDGAFAPVPAEDREGRPHDFSQSARLAGAENQDLVEQGRYDGSLGSSHLGIVNSPEAWRVAFEEPGAIGEAAPAAAPGSRRCASPRARLGARGIGRFRVGLRRAALLRRAGPPSRQRGRRLSFCVRGGGRLVVALSRRGRVLLVATTAPAHHTRGRLRPGGSLAAARRSYPRLRRLRGAGRGLYATRRSSPVLFGVRRGRVRFLAAVDRRLARELRLLRRYRRLAGV
jgi:lipase (class 2)